MEDLFKSYLKSEVTDALKEILKWILSESYRVSRPEVYPVIFC